MEFFGSQATKRRVRGLTSEGKDGTLKDERQELDARELEVNQIITRGSNSGTREGRKRTAFFCQAHKKSSAKPTAANLSSKMSRESHMKSISVIKPQERISLPSISPQTRERSTIMRIRAFTRASQKWLPYEMKYNIYHDGLQAIIRMIQRRKNVH